MGATITLQAALKALKYTMMRHVDRWYDAIANIVTDNVLPYTVGSATNPKVGEISYLPYTPYPGEEDPPLYSMNYWDGSKWVSLGGSQVVVDPVIPFTLDDATLSGNAVLVDADGELPRRISHEFAISGCSHTWKTSITAPWIDEVPTPTNLNSGGPGLADISNPIWGGDAVSLSSPFYVTGVTVPLALGRGSAGSISFWVRPNLTPSFGQYQWMASTYVSATTSGWVVGFWGTDLMVGILDGLANDSWRCVWSESELPLDTWAWLCVTYDGAGNFAVYRNGVVLSPTVVSTTLSRTPPHFDGISFGAHPELLTSQKFTGGMCRPELFPWRLSPSEVAVLYIRLARARFSLPGHTGAKLVVVSGATNIALPYGEARAVRGYLSLDGGATRAEAELNAYTAAGLPVGGTGTGLTIDLDISQSTWVADADGTNAISVII